MSYEPLWKELRDRAAQYKKDMAELRSLAIRSGKLQPYFEPPNVWVVRGPRQLDGHRVVSRFSTFVEAKAFLMAIVVRKIAVRFPIGALVRLKPGTKGVTPEALKQTARIAHRIPGTEGGVMLDRDLGDSVFWNVDELAKVKQPHQQSLDRENQ